MTLLWIIVIPFLVILAVLTIVDVLRHPYSGGVKAGWIVGIILLPVIVSVVYWFSRKPTREDVDQAYLASADARAHRQHSSSDRAGF